MQGLDEPQARFKVVFRGELLANHSVPEVRLRLQESLLLKEQQLDRLFSGKPTILRKGLTEVEASRYKSRLAALGAKLELHREQPSSPPLAPAAPAPPKVSAPANTSTPAALTLEPIDQSFTAPAHHRVTDEPAEIETVIKEQPRDSAAVFEIPILAAMVLIVVGIFFVLIYTPLPSGLFKNGFIVGVAFIVLGAHKYRKSTASY